jgi:chromosome segregation ATPase
MGEAATLPKEEAEEKSGAERKPLWWALAFGIGVLSLAVAYRIVKSDGNVDFQGGMDGIQVKISQAQKTIASAQQEVADAQKQLDERDALLKAREQAMTERETKVQELLASLDKPAAPPQQVHEAQTQLRKLRATVTPPPAAPEPTAMKVRIEKLDELRANLNKTNAALGAAAKPAAAP